MATRGGQRSHLGLCPCVCVGGAVEGPAHLQVRVAEHHQLSTGVDVVPLDEGQVHSPDSLQTREAGTGLPGLRVLLHHLQPELGLLAVRRWQQRVGLSSSWAQLGMTQTHSEEGISPEQNTNAHTKGIEDWQLLSCYTWTDAPL